MSATPAAPPLSEYDRVKSDLLRARRDGEAGASRARLVGLAASGIIAALVVASGPPLAAAIVLLLLILTPLLSIMMLVIGHYDEAAEEAASTLALLEREQSDTQALLGFANSGARFALFLRSFASEAEGLSAQGLKRLLALEARQARLQNRYEDFGYAPDIANFDAHAKWTKELGAVEALAAHMPVVLLTNLRISPDMRGDLDRLSVKSLAILAQDWYDVFTALAARARLSMFYVEHVSPSLRREIAYAGVNNLDYIVVASESDAAAIAQSFDGGAAFVAGAKAKLAPDQSDLPQAIASAVRAMAK